MKKNEGFVDRVIRVIIGIVLIVIAFYVTRGILSWVLGIIGIIAIVTGETGYCGLYSLIGVCTLKKKKE